ncbi:MAG: molybdopterin molybdotransferase MoeA, partial [Gammaproteobacteria bacterium]|nr:molybdopterin molybdotransferase MoeA [Gammaproteobacteria bacterium]
KQQLLEQCERRSSITSVNLASAVSHILAESISAPIDVPGFANSAMDGYALRLADLVENNQLKLIGYAFAGRPFNGQVETGECIRIMTGAALPKGCDCVIAQESTRAGGATQLHEMVEFLTIPERSQNIRPAGHDIRKDQPLFQAGRRLGAADIGLLSSLGIQQVATYKPINIAVFSTGDELQQPGATLNHGQIYDSNRSATIALLSDCGFIVRDLGNLPDDRTEIRKTLLDVSQEVDAIITSGGVSVGDADYLPELLQSIGALKLYKVAMRPGKPFAFGTINQCYFFGLPGNPVSSLATLLLLALPALRKIQGQSISEPNYFLATLQTQLQSRTKRLDFQRATLSTDKANHWQALPFANQLSGALSSMSLCNGFIVIDPDVNELAPGATVKAVLFDELIRG